MADEAYKQQQQQRQDQLWVLNEWKHQVVRFAKALDVDGLEALVTESDKPSMVLGMKTGAGLIDDWSRIEASGSRKLEDIKAGAVRRKRDGEELEPNSGSSAEQELGKRRKLTVN